jgi:hypothetical protein
VMGYFAALAAQELVADRRRAAERARLARASSSLVGPAAMRRQRTRVLQSLVRVRRQHESAVEDSL